MKTQKNTMKTASRVLKYLGRYKLLMLLSFLLAAASVAMTLYIPILIGRVIDCFAEDPSVETIAPYLVKITVLVLLTAFSQWLMNAVNNRISFHIVRDVRNDAIRKIQRLPLSYLDSHKTGDIVSRMISDVDQFADGMLMGFSPLFT